MSPDESEGWNSGRDAWDHWDENAWDLERWQETAKEKPAVPLPRRNGGIVGRHAVEADDKPPADPHDSPMRIEGSPDEVYGAGQVDWNQMPVAGQGYHVTPAPDDTQRQLPVAGAPPATAAVNPAAVNSAAAPSDDEIDWWNETSRGGTDADHHEDLFHGHADLPQRQPMPPAVPPMPQRQPMPPAVPPIPELDAGPTFNGFIPSQAAPPPEPYEPFVPAAAPVPEPPVFDEYQDLRTYPAAGPYEEPHFSGQFARQAVPPPPSEPEPEAPAEEEGRRIPLLLIAAIVGLVLVGVGVWTKWPRDESQASPQRPGPTLSVGPVVPPADGSNPLPVGPTDTPSAVATTTPGAPTTTRRAPQPTPTTRRPPTSNPAPPPPPPPPPPSQSASASPSDSASASAGPTNQPGGN